MTDKRDPLAEVMTARAAAEFYNLHESTVKKACQQGRIPSRKSGGTWLVSSAAAFAMWGRFSVSRHVCPECGHDTMNNYVRQLEVDGQTLDAWLKWSKCEKCGFFYRDRAVIEIEIGDVPEAGIFNHTPNLPLTVEAADRNPQIVDRLMGWERDS